MMVPKTCRHREHKCYIAKETGCSLRLMFRIFMLFPFLPWIWNYILSLPVQLRHESCLFFESLIWSLCNEHHGSRILLWCPHKFWSHVYARSYQSAPLSMYIWLSLDSPHSSSYFFTIRYSSHLYPPLRNASSSTLMNQISNVKSFQKDTPSERIRVIPLDLQLRRHVYLIFFLSFQRRRGEIRDYLEPARRVICYEVIYIKHPSTPFWSFSACSVLFIPTNDPMFMYSCGTVYFHGYGYFSKMILLNRASCSLNSSWSPDLLIDMAFIWLTWISRFCSHADDSSLTNIAFPSESGHFFMFVVIFPNPVYAVSLQSN